MNKPMKQKDIDKLFSGELSDRDIDKLYGIKRQPWIGLLISLVGSIIIWSIVGYALYSWLWV